MRIEVNRVPMKISSCFVLALLHLWLALEFC